MSEIYEWDRKSTLKLIDTYKNYEALWNSNHPDYKNKIKRFKARNEIADSLNIDKSEIERKFKNVSSNYLRELKKERESKLRGGPVYKSKWYAFKSLKYLNSRPIHHRSRGTILDPDVCAQILTTKREESRLVQISDESSADDNEPAMDIINESPPEYDETTTGNATPPYDYKSKVRIDTVAIKVEDPLSKPYEKAKPSESTSYRDEQSPFEGTRKNEPCKRNSTKDEPTTFGEYIAKKIRPMDRRTKAIVEYEINSIIFKAEMGFYEDTAYDRI